MSQKDFLHKAKSWWNYQRNGQGKYYLHSPFVYQFYTEILEPKPDETCWMIDRELFKLKQNREVFLDSFVGQLLKQETALKYGKVIYLLLKQSKAQYVLELHSTFGISTAYLALSKEDIFVTSINDSADFAKDIQRNLALKNVDFLPFLSEETLKNFPRLDAVFCHALAGFSLEKFLPFVHDETIFICDNIHESEAAESVWEAIKQHPRVTLTIDLFKLGLVFFRKENLAKTDFILRY